MLLLLVCLALTALGFYYGFVHPKRSARLQAAFLVGMLLTAAAIYALWNERQALGHLASLVPVVPDITDVSVPPAPNPRYIMVTTSRTPSAVREFYRTESNRLGWELEETGDAILRLRRPDRTITLFVTERLGETQVTYDLEPPSR